MFNDFLRKTKLIQGFSLTFQISKDEFANRLNKIIEESEFRLFE